MLTKVNYSTHSGTVKSNYRKLDTIASPLSYIGLDNLKIHLGIYEDTSEDVYLSGLLLTATDLVSNYIGRDLGGTTYKEFFPDFYQDMELSRSDTIYTEVATALTTGLTYTITHVGTTDFTTVGAADNNVGTSFVATGVATGTGEATTNTLVLQYYNESDVLITVDSSKYLVDETGYRAVVRLKSNQYYPDDVTLERENPVVVTYKTSLESDEVPEAILQAIYMYASELYHNRGLSSEKSKNKLPLSAERLLQSYRKVGY
jgi:hypothetical protein